MSTYDKRKTPLKNIITLLVANSQKALSSTFEALSTQIFFWISSRLDALEAALIAAVIRWKVTTYTANGAIALTSGIHVVAKTSAAAMTVAAPANIDGAELVIISNTDYAHVITFTGATLLDGTTGANLTVTMTAFKGSAITVVAVGTKWLLKSSSNVASITV